MDNNEDDSTLKQKPDPEKDKEELEDILKKVENSYICRALGYVDSKLRAGRVADSAVTRGFDYLKDFMLYSNVIGMLPQEQQEQYTKLLGDDKLRYTKYSIVGGYVATAAKFSIACLSPGIISAGFWAWGVATVADSTARAGYIRKARRPIGSIIYTEIPYRILKPMYNAAKRVNGRKRKNVSKS